MAPDQVPPNNFPNTLANCAIRQYARGMTTSPEAQRGELATIVARSFRIHENGVASVDHVGAADRVLAAGYRKPRTITTVEELDALPEWSVIRSEQATIWEKLGGDPTGSFWAETLPTGEHPSDHIALPATVLWEPEV